MTEKTKEALRIVLDAIMEERPQCMAADIHIEGGVAVLYTSEREPIAVALSYKDRTR